MSLTERKLYLTNNSPITLHVNACENGATYDEQTGIKLMANHVIVGPGAQNVQIGTCNTWFSNDHLGWIDLGRTSEEKAYMVYAQRNGTTDRSYAQFGNYFSPRDRNHAVTFESADVGSGVRTGDDFFYIFNGKSVTFDLRLEHAPDADVWQFRSASGVWTSLGPDHTDLVTIDNETTSVTLQIHNACGRDFYLDVDHGVVSGKHVRPGAQWVHAFPAGMATGQSSEYAITGRYSDGGVIPHLHNLPFARVSAARDELPDPTFKITRSGG